MGRIEATDQFRFLPESRPATDMLSIEVALPGDYAVAAPR
jgi:hypothetical protein